HPGADQDECLAAGDGVDLLEERSQHAQACVALSFVLQRRPADLEHETLATDVLGWIPAFASHDRFQERGLTRCSGTRGSGKIDNFGRAQMKLIRWDVTLSNYRR